MKSLWKIASPLLLSASVLASCGSFGANDTDSLSQTETLSQDYIQSTEATESGEGSKGPSFSSDETLRFYRWSYPIRGIILPGSEYEMMWGLMALEPYLTDHLDGPLQFGDMVTLEFECTLCIIYEKIPCTTQMHDYRFVSVSVDPGRMVEVNIVDGIPQFEEKGLSFNEEPLRPFARDEDGKAVSLEGLSKAYAGVSSENPSEVLGLTTYPFR